MENSNYTGTLSSVDKQGMNFEHGSMDFSPIDFKEELNAEQYKAVISDISQPALVLAGAGSGKTRTLTYRVAYLLTQGIRPWEILLLTFTNKAAREMLSRVEDLTGISSSQFWGGTFHSIGARILRTHGSLVGINANFTILDEDDAEGILKEVIKKCDGSFLKSKEHPSASVLQNIISYARNTLQPVDVTVESRYPYFKEIKGLIAEFAAAYKQEKLEQQVVDYDDLLEYWLELLRNHTEVRTRFNERFSSLLVDEYQDTNAIQSEIIDLMAGEHRIMAVGDDAQCIYTWRGANFENIMNFPGRHPGTEIHKIEINYRSTPEILHLANCVLENQPMGSGYEKELRSIRESGQKPALMSFFDTRQQAKTIAHKIVTLVEDEGFRLSDIAILYRAHYHAMDLQMELGRAAIPYVITSGVRFFEQAHVRDLVAHLRVVANPKDSAALSRLLCLLPKVGPKTALGIYNKGSKLAEEKGKTLIQVLDSDELMKKIPEPARDDYRDLAYTLQNVEEGFRSPVASKADDLFSVAEAREQESNRIIKTPEELVRIAIEGWYGDYMRNIFPNWMDRREDLDSVAGFASQYKDMNELLAQLVLLNSETSDRSVEIGSDCLRLTTVHQAKGLEYPVVFVIGLADGMFPLKRAIEADDLEEERRLFYVAVTRARDQLYLSYPVLQSSGGPPQRLDPSRFVQELDPNTYSFRQMRPW